MERDGVMGVRKKQRGGKRKRKRVRERQGRKREIEQGTKDGAGGRDGRKQGKIQMNRDQQS